MYYPFLKAKRNEIIGLRNLRDESLSNITPFFDIVKSKTDNEKDVKDSITTALLNLNKLYEVMPIEFYIDVYDLPFGVFVEGLHAYEYTLQHLSHLNYIPVIGLDRDPGHLSSVINNLGGSDVVAIRLLEDDISTPNMTLTEISNIIRDFPESVSFDVILDYRVISSDDLLYQSTQILAFLRLLSRYNWYNKVIFSGSSIPSIITDICDPRSSTIFERKEWSLWRLIEHGNSQNTIDLRFGDYTVVSPEYSDSNIAPELMRTVQTPKIIYTNHQSGFIRRGGALKRYGDRQYYEMCDSVVKCGFYRGQLFSFGDQYIYDTYSRLNPTCGNAAKWINITVTCHVEYMASIL